MVLVVEDHLPYTPIILLLLLNLTCTVTAGSNPLASSTPQQPHASPVNISRTCGPIHDAPPLNPGSCSALLLQLKQTARNDGTITLFHNSPNSDQGVLIPGGGLTNSLPCPYYATTEGCSLIIDFIQQPTDARVEMVDDMARGLERIVATCGAAQAATAFINRVAVGEVDFGVTALVISSVANVTAVAQKGTG